MRTTNDIQITDQNKKDLGSKLITYEYDVSGIYLVEYAGKEYWFTGKNVVDTKTGKRVKEMATETDERLWIAADRSFINLD